MKISSWLLKEQACADARKWARGKSPRQIWESCERPDWLLWLLHHLGYDDDKTYRLYSVWCARQVQHLMTDRRSIDALDVAERHANGDATDNELAAAWDAAWAAAWDARDSARAAKAARDAAWASAKAARDAAWAAKAARDAAWASAWDAASDAQSNRLREMVSFEIVADLMRAKGFDVEAATEAEQ